MEIKITAYADDINLILDGSAESLRASLETFQSFEAISGLHLNKNKTRPFWFGKHAQDMQIVCPDLDLNWSAEPIEVLGVKIPLNHTADTADLNYRVKVHKLREKLERWDYKYLTPYGKTHLVKTEALSQLVYLMTILPKPSKQIARTIETILFKFLWGNKRDKIKRATLKSKYKAGGLQVPDICTQADSLKISWIKKFNNADNNSKWKSVVKECFTIANDTNIFECRLSPSLIKRSVKSKFWQDVLTAWTMLKHQSKLDGGKILSEVLWKNCSIDLEKKRVLDRTSLLQKGLKYVGDVYDTRERRMLTANEVAIKFEIFPTLALTILRSIPRQWKDLLSREKPNRYDRFCSEAVTLESKSAVAKWAYSRLLPDSCPPEKALIKWKTDLFLSDTFNWSNVFEHVYALSDNITLRWLQFRLLHRILPTNKRLELYGITTSDKCHRCPRQIETLLHIFWSCPTVNRFWRELSSVFSAEFNTNTVILNLWGGQETRVPKQSIEMVMMLAKLYIWRCRSRESHPSVQGLLETVRNQWSIDKYISIVRGTEAKFEALWGPMRSVWENLG